MNRSRPAVLVQRGTAHLKMTKRERAIMSFIANRGENYAWTFYESHNIGEALGFQIDMDQTAVRRILPQLYRRDWLIKIRDERGRPMLRLTQLYIDLATTAERRREVRFCIGVELWERIKGTDDTADAILDSYDELAGSLKKHARRSAMFLLREKGSPPTPLKNVRVGKRRMRLIEGEVNDTAGHEQ